MRRVIVISALFFAMFGLSTASATEVGAGRNFGLGFQVGDPTAIIGKVFLNRENAFDFGLGFWGYGYGACYDKVGHRYDCGHDYQRLSIHGDFLWQYEIVRTTVKLDW